MKYLIVLLTAASPILELRGAIPLAIFQYNFSPLAAFVLSVIGNILPVIILLKYLEPVSNFLSEKSAMFKKFFNWLFTRTWAKHSKSFEIWGSVALVIFVAIPLPLTGAWTGAGLAFLMKMPFLKAFSAIVLGVLVAGIIVLAVVWLGVGIGTIFGWQTLILISIFLFVVYTIFKLKILRRK